MFISYLKEKLQSAANSAAQLSDTFDGEGDVVYPIKPFYHDVSPCDLDDIFSQYKSPFNSPPLSSSLPNVGTKGRFERGQDRNSRGQIPVIIEGGPKRPQTSIIFGGNGR